MITKLLAFILYFVLVIAIGIYFFVISKSTNEKDYFLGGRKMGAFVTAMSAQASDMSGWLLMGFPGSIFAFGMGKVWIGIGLAIGTSANWIFVATRLRKFSQAANDSITLPQYLTNRFASSSPILKVICAIIFLISFTVYVASSFTAGTAVLTDVIPWFENHQNLAMILFAVIILFYTFLGGFNAVCWTDFFQALLMLMALLAVPITMKAIGNFDASYAGEFTEGIEAFGSNPFKADWHDIINGLAWGLGYFGMPHIIVRFMSIEKASMIKKSATVAIIWVILTLAAAIFIAILGRTFILSDGTSLAQALLPDNRKLIFIKIVGDIFPPFIAGLMLSAIIAAAMSTADSQLLVAASAFTSDIYKPLIRKDKASDKEIMWISRAVVAVIAVVAYFIAEQGLHNASSWAADIMNMVENAWGLFGSSFGPVIILSLFWKRFNYKGAVAGITVGAVLDILWLLLFTDTATKALVYNTNIYELIPGFILGSLAAVIVSLCTKAPSKEVEEIFDRALSSEIE